MNRRPPARPEEHTLGPLTYAELKSAELKSAELKSDRPAVVLLHGLGARWQVFAPLFAGLRDHFHLYALDFRGHGTSGRTPGHYRLEDYVDDALALLDHIGRPVAVYGHSLGGWVALSLAAERPADVRGVVVAESAIYPEDIDAEAAISYLADLPLALRSVAKSLRQLDPDVMVHFRDGRLIEHYDATTLLPRVTCPALLLQGDAAKDSLMTDADVKRALGLLPKGAHVRLDGLGHGFHVEDAQRVLELVVPFFEGL